jgi:hypothetical protein
MAKFVSSCPERALTARRAVARRVKILFINSVFCELSFAKIRNAPDRLCVSCSNCYTIVQFKDYPYL